MMTRDTATIDRIREHGGAVSVRSTTAGDRWSSGGGAHVFQRGVLDRLAREGKLTRTVRGAVTIYETR